MSRLSTEKRAALLGKRSIPTALSASVREAKNNARITIGERTPSDETRTTLLRKRSISPVLSMSSGGSAVAARSNASCQSLRMTAPITENDIKRNHIRIPRGAVHLFPTGKHANFEVQFGENGEVIRNVLWCDGVGPKKNDSAQLRFAKACLDMRQLQTKVLVQVGTACEVVYLSNRRVVFALPNAATVGAAMRPARRELSIIAKRAALQIDESANLSKENRRQSSITDHFSPILVRQRDATHEVSDVDSDTDDDGTLATPNGLNKAVGPAWDGDGRPDLELSDEDDPANTSAASTLSGGCELARDLEPDLSMDDGKFSDSDSDSLGGDVDADAASSSGLAGNSDASATTKARRGVGLIFEGRDDDSYDNPENLAAATGVERKKTRKGIAKWRVLSLSDENEAIASSALAVPATSLRRSKRWSAKTTALPLSPHPLGATDTGDDDDSFFLSDSAEDDGGGGWEREEGEEEENEKSSAGGCGVNATMPMDESLLRVLHQLKLTEHKTSFEKAGYKFDYDLDDLDEDWDSKLEEFLQKPEKKRLMKWLTQKSRALSGAACTQKPARESAHADPQRCTRASRDVG
eukprot:SAG11_NODE_26_length_23420_cov_40.459886_27_plen_582_part_00